VLHVSSDDQEREQSSEDYPNVEAHQNSSVLRSSIRDRPISPRSPWQNPYAERLIGTLRRECLDHVLIVGERHLRRMLASYSSYYNESRTHLALEKDAPLRRAIQRCGAIITTPILSGLHHRYVRI
jgi:transposase InsO family protein